MSTTTLFRLAGFTALIVSAVSVVFNIGVPVGLIPAEMDGYRSLTTLLINLFVVTGLYAAQSHKAGVTGLAGYLLSVMGLAGNVGLRFVYILVAPILMARYPDAAAAAGAGPLTMATSLTFIAYALGFILFGVATFRAGVYPRWAGAVIGVGALLSYGLVMLPFNIGGLLINLGLIWLGWSLVAGKPTAVLSAQPQMA